MPAIEVRPAIESDIPILTKVDHNYTTDRVWQLDLLTDEAQSGGERTRSLGLRFREVRLPRAIRVEYPRSPKALIHDWTSRSGVLIASLEGEVVGYTSLMQNVAPLTTWVTDLVVTPRLRRQGIGSALVLAAQEWAASHPETQRLVLEMQHKNVPTIYLAEKLGFEFCGYNDHYYASHDVALFFSKWV